MEREASSDPPVPSAFHYPATAHLRRHGPSGYEAYPLFKPWLRDEFTFRCVYCLSRERWYPNGQDSFSVDHVNPQVLSPERILDYDNLVYACIRCNSVKQATRLLDPCETAFVSHVLVRADGTVEGLTQEGHRFIRVLMLNNPTAVAWRQRFMRLLTRLGATFEASEREIADWLGFPSDLPDLVALRPPGKNSRPEGARSCAHVLRQRGLLPGVY